MSEDDTMFLGDVEKSHVIYKGGIEGVEIRLYYTIDVLHYAIRMFPRDYDKLNDKCKECHSDRFKLPITQALAYVDGEKFGRYLKSALFNN